MPDNQQSVPSGIEGVADGGPPAGDDTRRAGTKAGEHHPLPADDRARHDALPESVENVRDKGEDMQPGEAGEGPEPRTYAEPDGSPYPG